MNATNLYVRACRVVMQADSDNMDSWSDLYKLLPYLRQSLSCTVCGKLLVDPYSPTESNCQHHVCEKCRGEKKRLKPGCSWCKDYETYKENTQMKLILKCYKKLCEFIKFNPIYYKISTIYNNGGQCNLQDVIDEAISYGMDVDNHNYILSCDVSSDDKSLIDIQPNDVLISCSKDIQENSIESTNSKCVSNEPEKSLKLSIPITSGSCDNVVINQSSTSSTINSVNSSKIKLSTNNLSKNGLQTSNKTLSVPSNSVDSHSRIPEKIVSFSNSLPVSVPLNASCLSSTPINTVSVSNIPVNTVSVTRPCLSSHTSLVTTNSIPISTGASLNNIPINKFSSISNDFVGSVIVNNTALNSVIPGNIDTASVSVGNIPVSSLAVSVNASSVDNTSVISRPLLNTTTSIPNNPISTTPSVLNNQIGLSSNAPVVSISEVEALLSSSTLLPSVVCQVPASTNKDNQVSSSCTTGVVQQTVIPHLSTQSTITTTQSSSTFTPTAIFSVSSTATTSSSTFMPGSIFSNTDFCGVKSNVIKEEPFQKHNSNVNNSSSMYSVMYTDGDSTKITIKRKPPESENLNVNKNSIDPDPLGFSNQELIKKPKPKPKPKPKRKGCRCGNATPTPGKLTCCGQRCPCYVEAKACIECRCRGCRNPHRPGGKKVRPVIPQLGNIQIHQVQPVHARSQTFPTNTIVSHVNQSLSVPNATVTTVTTVPQTIRAVQAMHAVQAVHGIGHVQTVAGGMHQIINISPSVMETSIGQGLSVHPVAGITMKPVNLALTSVPTQLLVNDDKSTSNSASDNSDVDVDIEC